ncbi:MAG: GNAT family N-acetyltransferase [Actinomycetota bacterium]|nr:GNAT family N-acetyltransferase [Actinomycetota bacterium]
MTIEIRACTPEELPRFVEVIGIAFGGPIPEEELPRFRDVLETDRMFAGFDGDTMVAASAAFSFGMTVPGGGAVPAAGVTMVGSLPTHRRQGTVRRLMRELLDDAKARREPVAILWASEESIYQRFGFGLASNQGHIKIEREKTRFLGDPPPVGAARLISLEEAKQVLPPIYDEVLPTRAGMLARPANWWQSHTLADPERVRGGDSSKFCAVFSRDGRDEAYALYRTGGDWDDAVARGHINAGEVVATNPVAYREMWRYLFSIDLVEYIKAWYLPQDAPLELMLLEPRRMRFAKSDSLWLRVIDVVEALQSRSYITDGEIDLAISDEFCPWNEGEWTLKVDGGRGSLMKGGQPDISLDIAALGAVYLGGYTFAQLGRALRAEECSEGAFAKADAMFRTDVAPWCVENF